MFLRVKKKFIIIFLQSFSPSAKVSSQMKDAAKVSKPIYIQMSRRKGFDLQKLSQSFNGLPAVKCTRPGKYGNVFIVSPKVRPGSKSGCLYITVPTLEDAIACYRERVEDDEVFMSEIRRELGGKNLSCWCKPGEPCHVQDVLLPIANQVSN